MPYEFGDVILVRFPFTSQTAFKQRPAVVVSSRAYNAARPDIVIMAITSQVRSIPGFGDIPIRDWQGANLLKQSAIKPVFATVEQTMVIRNLGELQAQDQSALRTALSTLLG